MQFAEAARLSELAGSPTYVLRAQLGAAQVQVERGRWETAVPILQKISAVAADFPQEAALAQSLLAQAPYHARRARRAPCRSRSPTANWTCCAGWTAI